MNIPSTESLYATIEQQQRVIKQAHEDIAKLTAERDAALAQRNEVMAIAEAFQKVIRQADEDITTLKAALREAKSAFEVIEHDSEECLDFDECMAMLVPIDAYHGMSEAIATITAALE